MTRRIPPMPSLRTAAEMLRPDPGGDPFALAPGRVHEVQGGGRHAFVLFQAARHPGALLWVLPAHASHLPVPQAMPDGVAGRLILIRTGSEADLLRSVEDSLRSGAAGLVIAEPERPLSLTAGRRLQLAAETGSTTGLIAIRGGAGSGAAETRWQCEPIPGDTPDSAPHRWSRVRNRTGGPGAWVVHWNGASASIDTVSAAGLRDEPPAAPR